MTREAEVVASDAVDVRRLAESLIDEVVQAAVDAATGLSFSTLAYLLTLLTYILLRALVVNHKSRYNLIQLSRVFTFALSISYSLRSHEMVNSQACIQ